MPSAAFAFRWIKNLQPRDRIVLIGKILPDATAFSINFLLNRRSNTIAYQMRTMLSDEGIDTVLHNWRDDTQWQSEEVGQLYTLQGEYF